MAVGDEAKAAVNSYVSIGREAVWGTYHTATATLIAIEALSCNFKTDIKSQIIPSLSVNRGGSRMVRLEKSVSGSLETYLHPNESPLIFFAALGPDTYTPTTVSSTYDHIMLAGNFGGTMASMSFNIRKGNALTYRYTGGRVNSLKISANVGEIAKISADFVFKDSTQLADDIADELSLTAQLPFTFAQGTFAYSSVTEQIQGFELTINNNLKTDKDARALGSNVLQVLPPTNRQVEFKITQRFDTTTTWTRFTEATNAAVQLVFTGASITADQSYKCTIDLAKVFYRSPDVEIKGPGDILTAEIPFDVVVDNPNTATGYDVKVTFKNITANYNV